MTQARLAPALAPLSAMSSPLAAKASNEVVSTGVQATSAAVQPARQQGRNERILPREPRSAPTGSLTIGRWQGQRASLTRHAILLASALTMAACKPPPDDPTDMPLASVERGKQAIARVGCGSCHTIDGIDWPRGETAPVLQDFSRRTLIAGRLPNRPDVLAAFVRDAPALVPDTAMPAMPVSEQEALDIARFLYRDGG